MDEQIKSKLAIQIAQNALTIATLETQNEVLQTKANQYDAIQRVLESDTDLRDLFNEVQAKLEGGNA